MRDLKGKTAIVTGGGQGIGKAITLRLAEEGCNVAIFDLKPDTAEETAAAAVGFQAPPIGSGIATLAVILGIVLAAARGVRPGDEARPLIIGAVGVIGPTRLNYGRIVPVVDYTAQLVGRLISDRG